MADSIHAIFGLHQLSVGMQGIARCAAAMQQACATIPGGETGHWQDRESYLGARCSVAPGQPGGVQDAQRRSPIARLQGDQPVAVLAHARIDNRGELADQLGLSRANAAAMDAASLILAAYQRWGGDCPQYLLGDFAFAIKDGSRLLLARDPLGIRPLYYSQGDGWLAFATDIHCVLAHPQVSARIANQAVFSYLLSGGFHDRQLTLYQHVQKLPPAHTLTFSASGIQLKRYWHPDRVRKMQRSEHSAEALRELLNDAVRVRLPEHGPVATHLSGGLDSSAITALAASQVNEPGRLQAWSWMRPPVSAAEQQDPEWRLAMAVAQKWKVPLHFTPFGETAFRAILERRPLLDNDSADLWYEFPVRRQLQERGIPILLSGWGGDQFISNAGDSGYLQALFSRRALLTLMDLGSMVRHSRRPLRALLSLTRHQLLAPLAAFLRWRSQRGAFNGWGDAALQFTTADFRRWCVKQAAPIPRVAPSLRLRSLQLEELASGAFCNRLEAWAASGTRSGVEYRFPLLDQRIIEFALALPPEQYRGAGMSRRVFRQALADSFPPELRNDVSKQEPRRVQEVYDTLLRVIRQQLSASPPDNNPWIDVPALQRAAASLPDPGAALSADALNGLLQVQRALMVALLNGDMPQP